MEEILDTTTPQEQPQNQPPPIISPWGTLGLLVTGILMGSLLASALSFLIGKMAGLDFAGALESFDENSPSNERYTLRLIAIVNQVFSFLLPAAWVVWLLYRREGLQFLRLDKIPGTSKILSGTFFILVAFPLAQAAYWLNRQLPLPEWITSLEDSTEALINGLLVMDTPWELIVNLITIALIPALAEEMVFRGVVQQTFERWFKNPVAAIWTAAVVFSFIHFQFEGFLPRVLLGAVLGYLFFWTRNLWVPVAGHFINNGIQVLVAYLLPEQLEKFDPEQMDQVSWGATGVSLVLTLLLGNYLRQSAKKQNRSEFI